jgi:predicted nuclease of predicted toxin-antitoxin system
MRFYLDEDLSDVIAVIGRERFGLDVVSAHALGMEHASDAEQLAFAGHNGRVIVTRNGDDFIRLTSRCLEAGLPHHGVVIVPSSLRGREFLRIARGLAAVHAMYPADTEPYLVLYLPDTRDR